MIPSNLGFYTEWKYPSENEEAIFQITKTERIVASWSTIEEIPKKNFHVKG